MRALPMLWLFLLAFHDAAAQLTDTTGSRSPSFGYHDELTLHAGFSQGRYGFLELGIGRNLFTHRHIPIGAGYFAGVELRPDRPEVMGVKVGAYMNTMVAMGVQFIVYPDPKVGGTVLRPEIGVGAMKWKVTYAYNVAFGGVEVPGINTHMVSFTYALRLLRLPGDDLRRSRR